MGVIQAQRNGKDFGATTRFRCSEHEQDTVESAKADCEKRCKASYNRVARNAAKHNGVYTNSGEF